jgi:hypothetical protein
MAYLTIQVIEKNRTNSPDNSGHGLVVLHGFVVLCVIILLRCYNIAFGITNRGFIGRLYVIDYLYNSMTNFTENSRVKLIEQVKVH